MELEDALNNVHILQEEGLSIIQGWIESLNEEDFNPLDSRIMLQADMERLHYIAYMSNHVLGELLCDEDAPVQGAQVVQGWVDQTDDGWGEDEEDEQQAGMGAVVIGPGDEDTDDSLPDDTGSPSREPFTGMEAARMEPLTERLAVALEELWESSDKHLHKYGFTDEMPSVWEDSRPGVVDSLVSRGLIQTWMEEDKERFEFTEQGRSLFERFDRYSSLKEEAVMPKMPVKGKGGKTTGKPTVVRTAKDKAREKTEEKVKVTVLRGPQVRILRALSKAKQLTRHEICEKAEVDVPFSTNFIGNLDPDQRKANEAKRGFKSLIGLGMIKYEEDEDETGKKVVYFSILAKGKEELKKIDKAEAKASK